MSTLSLSAADSVFDDCPDAVPPPSTDDDNFIACTYTSTSLKKMMTLPNLSKFKVFDCDVAIEGNINCYTHGKGGWFDKITKCARRRIVITRQGFMVLYMEQAKGYVLEIQKAKALKMDTDKLTTRKKELRRCHVKVKYDFGTVNIFLLEEQIAPWRNAIQAAHDGVVVGWDVADEDKAVVEFDALSSASETALHSSMEVEPLEQEEEEFSCVETDYGHWVAPAQPTPLTPPTTPVSAPTTPRSDVSDKFGWKSFQLRKPVMVPPQPRASVDSLDSSNSGLFSETEKEEDCVSDRSDVSVRCGSTSVSVLRRQLESKMLVRGPPPRCPGLPASHMWPAETSTDSAFESMESVVDDGHASVNNRLNITLPHFSPLDESAIESACNDVYFTVNANPRRWTIGGSLPDGSKA